MEEGFVTLAPGITASDYALKHLGAALAKAHQELQGAKKDAKNPYEDYDYVDLDSAHTAAREVLTKNGLVVMQDPLTDDEKRTVTVYTRIAHPESGEWKLSSLTLSGAGAIGKGGEIKYTQKTQGAAITYGRKYGFKAVVGISDASDDDVDKTGNKSDEPEVKRTPKPAGKVTEMPKADDITITPGERQEFFKACYEYGANDDDIKAAIKAITGKVGSKTLTRREAGKIILSFAKPETLEAQLEQSLKLTPEASAVADSLEGGEVIP
jgi:hypothetical protein